MRTPEERGPVSKATPESRHRKHRFYDKPMGRCRDCAEAWRRCRAKVRYQTLEAVNGVAMDTNIETEWRLMLAGYRCPYCTMYHLTRSKPGTARWKRIEKRRRRWLVQKVAA